MGCCCSSSSPPTTTSKLHPLRPNSRLFAAQQLTVTASGKTIQKIVRRLPMKQSEVDSIPNDPNVGEDFRLIFGPPFNVCTKLTKFVYLSGIGSLSRENLKKEGFTLIVNATYEWPCIEPEGIMCIRVPVDDAPTDDISIYFDDVSDKIEENTQLNGKTLIHCLAGASRSTTLAIAYLVKYEKIPLKNAFNSVYKRRECARPNMGFWEQLIKYEIKVKGQSSVRMITKKIDGFSVTVPDFYEKDYQMYYLKEVDRQVKEQKDKQENPLKKTKSQKQFNPKTNNYE
ncbi:dual specificity protein phosphatase 21-like [Oppia nitens]|uniref:dual specificity protein phosphatase 21-like n=1 Tax=Oppia nitens TaxID=1686743 RepID=UPI0023DADCCF|nr:dual specificity protein phosphatase 21-like [Oppia nitens]